MQTNLVQQFANDPEGQEAEEILRACVHEVVGVTCEHEAVGVTP